MIINIAFAIFLVIRLWTLKISIKNERALKSNGAIEHGALNSKLLSFLHIIFYLSCIIEANLMQSRFDMSAQIGLALMIFAYLALFWVINALGPIWTVKIYIMPNHKINNHMIFRIIRHPNYFLNIAPELVGLALLCGAKMSAIVLLPLYIIVLAMRIYQEERAMSGLIRN
ncbi:MAG: isoprenylcysteine carboxyl methyltransferase family protein [Helicobacter sp.]|nr:isoprenylcysteine carboxyl methyltransferase family protein [Helicobacter sp.]